MGMYQIIIVLKRSLVTTLIITNSSALGLPAGNLNDDIDYGVMAAHTTVFKGRRWSSFTGHLKPALDRPNLHVMLHTQVTKVHCNALHRQTITIFSGRTNVTPNLLHSFLLVACLFHATSAKLTIQFPNHSYVHVCPALFSHPL